MIRAWHRWAAPRPGFVLLLCLVFAAVALAVNHRATSEQDMAALLPGGPGSPREAAELLREFGTLNTLLVDLEVPGADAALLAQRGTDLTLSLRGSGLFAEVYTGPGSEELRALGGALLPHRLELLSDPARVIAERLNPAILPARLVMVKSQLGAPQAMLMKGELLKDPLGLDADLFGALQRMAGEVESYRGQLLSKDHRHVLLVTTPRVAALDTQASQRLLDELHRLGAQLPPGPAGPVILRAVGGPRFAAESAAAVKRDVVLTIFTSVLMLMALFFLRFRNLGLLVLVSIPIGLGVLGGLVTVILVQGHFHALTLGFGAVLIGVAVDYPIYLLNAASVQEGTSLEHLEGALRETGRALWLGFITTFFGFMTLLASKFPGLRELALFAGAGIATAFAVTIFLLVPLAARFGPRRWRPVPTWISSLRARPLRPGLAVAVTVLWVVASGVMLPRLRYDGELRHLDAQRPETLAEFDAVGHRFGLQGAEALVVSKGASEEEALVRNDAVAVVMAAAQARGEVTGVRGIASFLPAASTQRAREKALAGLDVSQGRALLAKAAEDAGFTPTAFDGFWSELASVSGGTRVPLTRKDFEGTSLGTLIGRLMRCGPLGCIAVTSFTPRSASDALALGSSLPQGATLLDGGALAANIIADLPKQLALLSGLGLLVSVAILTLAFRSLRLALFACLPCSLGLLATLGTLAATGVPLNLVSGSALVLVLGCGVDYGIFVLQEVTGRASGSGVESMGVVLAAASTLAGFGTLVLASHQALHSLGAAVGLGVFASAVSALFLLPGLYRALTVTRTQS